jgi:hypothetical protein
MVVAGKLGVGDLERARARERERALLRISYIPRWRCLRGGIVLVIKTLMMTYPCTHFREDETSH